MARADGTIGAHGGDCAGDGAAAETGATRGEPGGAAVAGGGDAVDNTDDEEGEEDEEEDSDVESAVGFGAAPKDKPKSAEAAESDDDDDDDDVFVAEEPSAGEQLGALKPWHAAIKPPTNAPPPEEVDCSPPSEELELSWVYGFRGYDTRRVAAWVGRRAGGDGGVGGGGGAGGGAKIVYPAAAVVVMYDTVTHEQRFFREHKDDVLGLAVHEERGLVASSQKSFREGGRTRKPTIWVWSAVDAKPLQGPLVFTACNQRWVSLLAFNPAGDLLCSVGADDDNTLVLWDWERGVALCHVPTQKERIYACRFQPSYPSDGGRPFAGRLVLAGKGFARLCETALLAESGTAQRRGETKLALPGRERAAAQLAVGFLAADLAVIGSASGGLVVFELASCKLLGSTKDAHRGPVNVLCEADGLRCTSTAGTVGALSAGGGLLSCGKDGQVRLWAWDVEGKKLVPLGAPALSLEAALPLLNGGRGGHRLRSMDWSAEHGLLLGTHASELLLVRESADECRVLTHGHAQRPVGGARRRRPRRRRKPSRMQRLLTILSLARCAAWRRPWARHPYARVAATMQW